MNFLIVVDPQVDFVNGILGSDSAQKVIPRLKKLIREHNKTGGKTIYTLDTHTTDYMDTAEGKKLLIPHCIIDTEGWGIVPDLREVLNGCESFRKNTFGSVELAKHIAELWKNNLIDSVTLCGFDTDICVVSNALMIKAFVPELPIRVLADYCAGSSSEKHKDSISVMESCQIECVTEREE